MSPGVGLGLAAGLGVLLGSIPFAWLLVRWRTGHDVARAGSGNVGALNASRVTRSRALGLLVLALDLGKGAAAAVLARALFAAPHADLVAGVAAVAGHDYNPWLSLARGRLVGGKGFATAAGAMLATLPWCVPLWFAILVPSYLLFRRAFGVRDEAPSSALATAMLPAPAAWVHGPVAAIATAAVAVLVLPKHLPDLRTLGVLPARPGAHAAPAPTRRDPPPDA